MSQLARRVPSRSFPLTSGTGVAGGSGFFVAAACLAMALTFFFAAFLPADFNFRPRMAFLVVALRFLGMRIPLLNRQAFAAACFSSGIASPRFTTRIVTPFLFMSNRTLRSTPLIV